MPSNTTATIKTDELSKASLVAIVDAARGARMFPESLIIDFYKHDLSSSINVIVQQQGRIEKELNTNKTLSRKAYAALAKKYNQIGRLGNKKLDLLRKLEGEK